MLFSRLLQYFDPSTIITRLYRLYPGGKYELERKGAKMSLPSRDRTQSLFLLPPGRVVGRIARYVNYSSCKSVNKKWTENRTIFLRLEKYGQIVILLF